MTLSNIRTDSEEGGSAEWVGRQIPEVAEAYPEARMFGRLPSYGLYARHVRGLRLRGLDFGAVADEARPAIMCDDVKNLDVDGLRSSETTSGQPVVQLMQTRSALLRGCSAPAGTRTYLRVEGDQSGGIVLTGSSLAGAEKPVEVAGEALPSAVSLT